MKKRFLLAILFTLIALPAFADDTNLKFLGELLDGVPPPPQACHIQWLFADGSQEKEIKGEKVTVFKKVSGCSATVVGESRVLFAASCIPDAEKSGAYTAQLVCGKTVKAFKDFPTAFPKYDKSKIGINDFAVMNTTEAIGVKPAKIPASLDEWQKIYKKENCVLFGYGDDARRETGKVRGIRALFLDDKGARNLPNVGEIGELGSKFVYITDNKIKAGDTGGGLLCHNGKEEKDREWYTMAVTPWIGAPVTQPTDQKWSDGLKFSTKTPAIAAMLSTPAISKWLAELDGNDNPKTATPTPKQGPAEKKKRNRVEKKDHAG